jgi:hypothetical protein
VVVDFFFEPGCPECEEVKREILPELQSRFEGFYRINYYDVGVESNIVRLVTYQRALGIVDNAPVSIVVDYRHVFSGVDAMRRGLADCVDERIGERLAPGWQPPEPIAVSVAPTAGRGVAVENMRNFALLAVLVGGLTDGINPCAISSLVFFMSLLAVAKVRGRGLIAMGAAFCLASFTTYAALGFGLLRALHSFSGLPHVRNAIDAVLIVLLAVLACLSFRDAGRYRATRNPRDVTLQLPESVKRKIHETMRTRLKTGNLVFGGLLIGVTVTALESVCTGQVYVPTLVVVIRSGEAAGRAWAYLLLYNAMFILPLVVVFALTYYGLRTQTLIEWSKRNVVLSKVLLGFFFVGMALLIVAMR